MSSTNTAEPGWYDDGTGRARWFDGQNWGDYAPEEQTEAESTAEPGWYDDGTGRARWFDGRNWGDYAPEEVATETFEAVTEPPASTVASEAPTVVIDQSAVPVAPSEVAPVTAVSAPPGPPESVVSAVPASQPVVVRRPGQSPFTPPEPEKASGPTPLVSRDWGTGLRASGRKKDSGLTRNREVAGDLPEWSPTPPGELKVRRATSASS
ncbi:MAG: hypothetical protein QM597_01000 [Aeromicrobium sp.]|uniref:hypothetical protein n=1 Tax=Aeromicrobium sp. TaxID=1871063 RepID=UPI0039E4B08B